MEKNCSKSFSEISNSSDIEEEIIKQINTLKPFDMEPYKDIPKKYFALGEENKREQEINLTPLDRIGNIDWRKCGCECKSMATFAESFCLFHRLKSRSARGALAIQLSWTTPRLLVTLVRFIYLVDEFFFLSLV